MYIMLLYKTYFLIKYEVQELHHSGTCMDYLGGYSQTRQIDREISVKRYIYDFDNDTKYKIIHFVESNIKNKFITDDTINIFDMKMVCPKENGECMIYWRYSAVAVKICE